MNPLVNTPSSNDGKKLWNLMERQECSVPVNITSDSKSCEPSEPTSEPPV